VESQRLSGLLPFRVPRERATVRLVCLPFAGGAALVYREWGKLLPEHIDICAIEFGGHGTRFGEGLVDDVGALADEILETLRPLMDKPAVLFGHSLGARVAFLLAQREPRFRMLIASGARAPHLPPRRLRAALSDEALVTEMARMGGTPPEILAEPEFMARLLPVLRADFRINERHVAAFDTTIATPVVALAAADDQESSMEEVAAWRSRTTGTFRLLEVDGGGHFFINSRRPAVIEHVRSLLTEIT
jgi:surfactin synthase thioesterase subunit